MSKFIQSFYQYPVKFSSIGKTIPAKLAQGELRNLAEVSDREYERLVNAEPKFRELVNLKKYRVLDRIPAGYVPASVQVNNAKAEADKYKAENEALKAKLAELEGKAEDGGSAEGGQAAGEGSPAEGAEGGEDLKSLSYEGLKEKAAGLGLEFKPNVKKADLVKMIEEATAKAE